MGEKKDTDSKLRLRLSTWNVGTMRRRSGEVAEVLRKRRVSVCCVQETRWKGGKAKWLGNIGSRYKFFWQGREDGTGGVGVLVAEEWVPCVQMVRRANDRIMVVRLMVGKRLVNVISAYAPQSGRPAKEKESFWTDLHDLVGGIPSEEGVLVSGDMNGHVGERE